VLVTDSPTGASDLCSLNAWSVPCNHFSGVFFPFWLGSSTTEIPTTYFFRCVGH
jgi:hypothetical protein